MKKTVLSVCFGLLMPAIAGSVAAQVSDNAHWPQWRGPFFNGMARGDGPTQWSDTTNIKWKVEIPGRGHSTPVIWGDRIFLTTAIPTGKPAATQPTPAPSTSQPATGEQGVRRRGRGPGGDTGPQVEHKFDVLALDRKTGKLLWQKTAKVAVPHEGYHRAYGSFASNSPVTDGKYVYASFGSRGIYVYDFNGKLIWEKDLGVQMKMRLGFGEGTAPLLLGDRLLHVFDHEDGSFIVALDKRTGKELWRTPRDERSSWSTPYAVEHAGRTQVVVTGTTKVRSYNPEKAYNLKASPVGANGKLYVATEDGDVVVVKMGEKFEVIATNTLEDQMFIATPVVAAGELYLRGQNHLFAISQKK